MTRSEDSRQSGAEAARSGAAQASRTVLLPDPVPAGDALVGELARRGLVPAAVTDRDQVTATLVQRRCAALVLPLTEDRTADTTLLLRAVETDFRLAIIVVGRSLVADDVAHFVRLGAAVCLDGSAGSVAIADAVEKALERRAGLLESDRQSAGLRAALLEVTQKLQNEVAAARGRWMGSLESLVRVGEVSHAHWAGHALRVSDLAGAIAVAMGEGDTSVESIRIAGRLHDLGMVGVPARVLEKPGTLTEEEFALVKLHPVLASEILSGHPGFADVTQAIRGHHENWDGSGYPDQLTGEAIPPMARILAAAEIFDALTSPRPYRPAEETASALAAIASMAGTVLDPAVCQAVPRVIQGQRTLPFVSDLPNRTN